MMNMFLRKLRLINIPMTVWHYINGRKIVQYRGTKLYREINTRLDITGRFEINGGTKFNTKRSSLIRMDRESSIIVSGIFNIYYGADIKCFEGSKLYLGSGYCNSNLHLTCAQEIKIGKNVAIASDVTIMDSDFHKLNGSSKPNTKPVNIQDHVWIGIGATILKGVTIGEGAVVAAASVVVKDVPAHSLVAGNPARVIKESVTWEK